jgi:hypothetical protein
MEAGALKAALAGARNKPTPSAITVDESANQKRIEERAAARADHAAFMAKQAAAKPEKAKAAAEWEGREILRQREVRRLSNKRVNQRRRNSGQQSAWGKSRLGQRGSIMRRSRGKARAKLALVDAIKTIVEEILPASVRAVCYRLFTQKFIPGMAKAFTDKVSVQLVYAREEGIVDWDDIVDETRSVERSRCWNADSFFEKTFRLCQRPLDRPAKKS